MKGVHIESIAWNPSQPTASTREILIGATDGNVYETYIEPSAEFYRREEKYLKSVYNTHDGPVTGLWADVIPGRPDQLRVMVATPNKLLHFVGRTGRQDSSGSIYTKLFESESPTVHEEARTTGPTPSCLVTSPSPTETLPSDTAETERTYAWLCAQGVYHGKLTCHADLGSLGDRVFAESKLLPKSKIPPSQTAGGRDRQAQGATASIALSQFHILHFIEGRVVAINRLDGSVVYDQVILEPGQNSLGLHADLTKNTYWLFTNQEIYEIVVTDESRDVWKIMLQNQQFDAASRFAKTAAQKDAVATASGDHLVSKGNFLEAATVYGRSTKPFEEVALAFIDKGEQDALRKYLLVKLANLKRSATMQRIMVATWLIELFMAKLNLLDDALSSQADVSEGTKISNTKDELPATRREYQDFVAKYKSDLDKKTTYEIISSHGREEELLHCANVVNDYSYVLSYWVQRERWQEAMNVLKKQTDPEVFYRYSSVLMSHVAVELVEVLMRQGSLDIKKLIPALLNYNKTVDVPLTQVSHSAGCHVPKLIISPEPSRPLPTVLHQPASLDRLSSSQHTNLNLRLPPNSRRIVTPLVSTDTKRCSRAEL